MLNKGNFLLCLGLLLSLVDCQCSDNLQSIAALARLEMCDRGSACGCNELPDDGASIDFGHPPPVRLLSERCASKTTMLLSSCV